MKKILITGANSYIGESFEKYINENFSGQYEIDTVDMIDGTWREKSFKGYDAVFHVAGIAHQKETKENAPLYYKVNHELAVKTAKKAKNEGVKQFIFLSTMSVYGLTTGIITKDTMPAPNTNYGRSKLEAEKRIGALADDDFKVCTLRPPMVYGEGCKGNYQTVVKIVDKFPFFPNVNNRRSMIHVDNLAGFVKMAIDEELSGLYFPQNKKYMNTKYLAKHIAKQKGKKLYFSFLAGFAVLVFRPFVPMLQKAFGNLVYKNTEDFEFKYCK